ncbi:hypothetical protein C1I98_15360 [Spongiactinospora gelatinilytica]|uniref:Uncharacterized protein n=1 Tax=Spongiactinospora gelatinilytica TaxID=2666298 RepID=A0A2W2GSZ1_9ACTN|nr:hypothetical protein C1I98_15360 [Spongiactinospora gelatinilytica]
MLVLRVLAVGLRLVRFVALRLPIGPLALRLVVLGTFVLGLLFLRLLVPGLILLGIVLLRVVLFGLVGLLTLGVIALGLLVPGLILFGIVLLGVVLPRLVGLVALRLVLLLGLGVVARRGRDVLGQLRAAAGGRALLLFLLLLQDREPRVDVGHHPLAGVGDLDRAMARLSRHARRTHQAGDLALRGAHSLGSALHLGQ